MPSKDAQITASVIVKGAVDLVAAGTESDLNAAAATLIDVFNNTAAALDDNWSANPPPASPPAAAAASITPIGDAPSAQAAPTSTQAGGARIIKCDPELGEVDWLPATEEHEGQVIPLEVWDNRRDLPQFGGKRNPRSPWFKSAKSGKGYWPPKD